MSLLNDHVSGGTIGRFERLGIETDTASVDLVIERLLKTFPQDTIKNEEGVTHPGIKGFELAFRQCEILTGLVEHEKFVDFSSGSPKEEPYPFLIADPIINGKEHMAALATKRGWRIGLFLLSHHSDLMDYNDTNATTAPKVLVSCPYLDTAIVAQAATSESPIVDFPNQWYGQYDQGNRKTVFSVVVDSVKQGEILDRYNQRQLANNELLSLV